MRSLLSIGLALALVISTACAGAIPIIAAITSIAAEAVEWVDLIADFVQRAPVDEQTRAPIAQAIQRARIAAIGLQRAARGAGHLSHEQLEAAFADFRAAYEALLALTEPLGVRKALPAGLLGVDREGVLRVPPADAFGLPQS